MKFKENDHVRYVGKEEERIRLGLSKYSVGCVISDAFTDCSTVQFPNRARPVTCANNELALAESHKLACVLPTEMQKYKVGDLVRLKLADGDFQWYEFSAADVFKVMHVPEYGWEFYRLVHIGTDNAFFVVEHEMVLLESYKLATSV